MPNLTLLDWAKRLDPDGSVAIVAQLLSQTNEILEDLVSVQGNLPTGHRCTISTGLPTTYYRSLNQGIPTSKSSTVQVDEGISIAESRSEVDIDLAELNGNTAEFRMTESEAFIESMNQFITQGLFYGNPAANSKEFLGLMQRYNDTNAGNAQNLLSMGGTGSDLTSVWLIGWGDRTVFCPFPKGSAAGLKHEDLGRQTSYDTGTTGERMEVYADRYQWKIGLVVKDWRSIARIHSVDSGDFAQLGNQLDPKSGTYDDLLHMMTQAIVRIPKAIAATVRLRFYMNASVFAVLMRTALEKSNSALSVQAALDQFGRPHQMLTFLGVPIRQCDAILNTESAPV